MTGLHRAAVVCSALGVWGFSAVVAAAPPTAEQFNITYFNTDEDQGQARRLNGNDLQWFYNRARCECQQAISTRIILQPGMGGGIDPVRIRTFAGTMCGPAQIGNNLQNRPCVQLLDELPNSYTQGITVSFDPIFLGEGVRQGSSQSVAEAVPSGSCASGQGGGGIWVCVEDSTQPDCQPEEFIIQGTQNENVSADDMGMGSAITFDYDAPLLSLSEFSLSSGDGSIQISWEQDSTGDVYGFRMLCADASGAALPGKGYNLRNGITGQNPQDIYFTASNLCPDGPFGGGEPYPEPDPDPGPLPDPSGGGDTGQNTGSGGGSTGFGAVLDPPEAFGGTMGPGTGSCCAAGTTPGCEDATCQSLVCAANTYCCDTGWDQQCADDAAAMCGVCGGPGDCCSENGTAACVDQGCADDVCAVDDFCCVGVWDSRCVARAGELCPACGGIAPGTTSAGTATTAAAGSGSGSGSGTASGSGTDGGLPTEGLRSLDWSYVCSSHVSATGKSVKATGLENGVTYLVAVVAYDQAGNPVLITDVSEAVPRETTDLWEQCEQQGNVCGNGGYCNCTTQERPPAILALILLGALGLRRRRHA